MSTSLDLDRIINSIADPIFVKDRKHRWVLLNDAYCNFMGVKREELIGKSDYDYFPKSEADVFWAKDEVVFNCGAENVNEETFTDNDGGAHTITTKKCLFVNDVGEKFIVGCIRDFTELKRTQQELQDARDRLEALVQERTAKLAATNETLQQQIVENERTADRLRQSQKLEAIGRLAGGIAHDFNNLLNVIMGHSALLEAKPEGDSTLRERAEQITKAADKAASLTRQLLAFSRQQVLQPEVLNLNDILLSMSKLLASLLGEDVELEIVADPVLGGVKADRGQIEQVVMNLAVNARDAMPNGGRVRIQTANKNSDPGCEHEVEPGEYVVLTVSDNGNGMDRETQAHIFEPFFTTKQPGKGTGLGLSTVYGIVRQSGGHIHVNSELRKGTVVNVYLPRVALVIATFAPMETASVDCGGSETILLVEDQQDLRGLFRNVLRSKGYTVLEASSGKEAIAIATAYKSPLDLLITDIIMPGMRGWKVAKSLVRLRPQIKVLYMSGYADTDLLKARDWIRGASLLEKPFRPDALLRKVREILASDAGMNAKAG